MVLYKFSYRNYLIGLAWWSCWIVLQTIAIVYTINLEWKIAFYDALATNILLAISVYAMITMLSFYQPRPLYRLAWTLGMSILCLTIFRVLMLRLFSQHTDYILFVENSIVIRGMFIWLMIALISALSWFWFYFKEHQEDENRKAVAEKLAREAELWQLRQQLQPHFLFNSLNSISALAGSKPDQARLMIQQLSDFLRGTLKKDDQQIVTLAEELQHLQLYLEIEKVRFGHRLKTIIQSDEMTDSMRLPTLLLQPVVENAIKFGLYDTIGEVTISIQAKREEGYLIVSVENPFDVATASSQHGTGFGLKSVQRRLYLLYARQDLLITDQKQNIFHTSVKIPQSI